MVADVASAQYIVSRARLVNVARKAEKKSFPPGERDVRHEESDKAQEGGGAGSRSLQGIVAFDEAAFKGGAIPLKYKELMAVAVALTTQCPYYIEIHAKKAKKAGATE